jgi:hypothetical protein
VQRSRKSDERTERAKITQAVRASGCEALGGVEFAVTDSPGIVVLTVSIMRAQRRKALIANWLQIKRYARRFMPIIPLQRRKTLRGKNMWHCDKM